MSKQITLIFATVFLLATSAYSQTKLLRFPDIRGDRVVFTELQLTGYAPITNGKFAFYGRTGGLNADQWLDNIQIQAIKSVAPLRIVTEPSDALLFPGWNVSNLASRPGYPEIVVPIGMTGGGGGGGTNNPYPPGFDLKPAPYSAAFVVARVTDHTQRELGDEDRQDATETQREELLHAGPAREC